MDLFKRMQRLTKGEPIEIIETQAKPEHGDIVQGTITNIIYPTDTQKGGYGFIASTALPFERIFFHWSGLRQDSLRFPQLEKRMKVEFILQYRERDEKHEGGYSAIKIRVL